MSERTYTVKYSVGGTRSSMYLWIDEDNHRSEEFVTFIQKLGFVFSHRIDYVIYRAALDNLNPEVVKYVLDLYSTSLAVADISYNINDIIRLYPGILDTLRLVGSRRLCLYIDYTCKEHLFYFQIDPFEIKMLLDTFDIIGLGFESYCYNDTLRIAVRNEIDLKKMKLIGLVDFIQTHYLDVPVVLTNTLFDRITWKL